MRYIIFSVFLATTILSISSVANAHGGRTDSSGCHNQSSTGTRHCHGRNTPTTTTTTTTTTTPTTTNPFATLPASGSGAISPYFLIAILFILRRRKINNSKC